MVLGVIFNEHWKRADQSVEIVQLPQGTIVVFYKDGEAIIFNSLWDFFRYKETGEQLDRVYCNEEELSYIYENFQGFYDILHNFDDKTGKRKENGEQQNC